MVFIELSYFQKDSIDLTNLNPVCCKPVSGEDFILEATL